MDGKAIEVERNGVRLGWNILAILATVGLGLYVSSIITPIKQDIEVLDNRITRTEQKMEENDRIDNAIHDEFNLHVKEDEGIHRQQDRAINSLQEQVNRIRGNRR